MIGLQTLKYLATQKLKDAEILMQNQRYNGAVYIMGYALEFSFKRKLSINLGFASGFPETAGEMQQFPNQLAAFNTINGGIPLSQIRQIRNHKLTDLIKYSGAETRIKASYNNEWQLVCCWNPEKRYVRQNWTAKRAKDFIAAANIVLKQIV
ncbi:hypothetical protein [Pinibacter aurantiacus]|uniref:Uncharacterized protein n=1 Tax=Pinibacter aurantiacus TaxID=2851599 RepID=A0A9E2W2S5_9BACT|nr:hypothetical protein [Pinibacter aurantiacus]MBV4356119.1 hypothetical protein [Pinibacter aurantiacus]